MISLYPFYIDIYNQKKKYTHRSNQREEGYVAIIAINKNLNDIESLNRIIELCEEMIHRIEIVEKFSFFFLIIILNQYYIWYLRRLSEED